MRTTLNIDDQLLDEARRPFAKNVACTVRAAVDATGFDASVRSWRTDERQSVQGDRVAVATDNEVMFYIEKHKLIGKVIGYVDAHLLAATSLTQGAKLWAKDKGLAALAHRLRIDYSTPR